MRAGGGKQKGAQYERDVCVALSLWISGGARKDLYWRSAMSGGRATVARKKGDHLAAQAGDITATDKAGCVLTDHYYVECKRYADLNFGGFLTKGIGPLAKFWQVACEEATKYDRVAMLIIREDRNETLVMVPQQSMLKRGMTGHAFGLNPKAHIATLHQHQADLYHFDRMMLKPYSAPAKYKHEGPVLEAPASSSSLATAMEWMPARDEAFPTHPVSQVKDLHMPDRIKKMLNDAGIVSVYNLLRMDDSELLRLPNFGMSALKIVRAALAMPDTTPKPKIVRERFTRSVAKKAAKKIVKKKR